MLGKAAKMSTDWRNDIDYNLYADRASLCTHDERMSVPFPEELLNSRAFPEAEEKEHVILKGSRKLGGHLCFHAYATAKDVFDTMQKAYREHGMYGAGCFLEGFTFGKKERSFETNVVFVFYDAFYGS